VTEWFKLEGRPRKASTEFVKAWLWASYTVLRYHKYTLDPITVEFVEEIGVTEDWDEATGEWDAETRTIRIQKDQDLEHLATIIIHEMIHAMCGGFGENTDEKCTSTLTAKLKPEIKLVADALLEGTYRRAAFFAHCKLSYRTDVDHYDDDQNRKVGVKDKFIKRTA
jgi:hypothetical protein